MRQMSESLRRALSVLALLGSIMLLAWVAAGPVRLAVSPPVRDVGLPGAPEEDSRPAPRASVDVLVSQITEAHLLGRASRQQPAPPQQVQVSALKLQVAGVFATGDEGGLALMGDGGGREQLYGVGALLPGGAELLEVLADGVVVDAHNQRQKLFLRKSGGSAGNLATRAPPSRAGTGVSLARIRDRFVADPSRLASEVRARPVLRRGEQLGYRLLPRGRGAVLFEALGLKAGDVVTGVNGVRLESAAAALSALGDLAKLTIVELDIERRGRPMQLSRVIR